MSFSELDESMMRRALEACSAGVEMGQSPFGAVIAHNDRVIIATHNHVRHDTDPTAHAEVCAIRKACAILGDIHLPGTTIYSTTEPCPMCFTAIHWARIQRIVFGAAIADAEDFGFNELGISNIDMADRGGSPVIVQPGCLRKEAVDLFKRWQAAGGMPY
ncbi:MAG: nucleoside deaminase [Phycisphaeraceae bacterium]